MYVCMYVNNIHTLTSNLRDSLRRVDDCANETISTLLTLTPAEDAMARLNPACLAPSNSALDSGKLTAKPTKSAFTQASLSLAPCGPKVLAGHLSAGAAPPGQ